MDFTNSITICLASATFALFTKVKSSDTFFIHHACVKNFNRIITAVFGHIFEKKQTSYTEFYSQNTKVST